MDEEPSSDRRGVRAALRTRKGVVRVLWQGCVVLLGALAMWLSGSVPGSDVPLTQEMAHFEPATPAADAFVAPLPPLPIPSLSAPTAGVTSQAASEEVFATRPATPKSLHASPTTPPEPDAQEDEGQDVPVAATALEALPDAGTVVTETEGAQAEGAQPDVPDEPVRAGGGELPHDISTGMASVSAEDVGIVVDGVLVPFVPSLPLPAAAQALMSTGQWVWPVRGEISQGYSEGHRALDLSTGHGAVVVAADAGRVVYARWESSGYGYLVIVDHGNGFVSYYAHLYGFYIDVGQEVARGEQIGELGTTGRSTGPHLHFEIRRDGVQRNPLDLLP